MVKQIIFDFGGVLVQWNPQKIVETFTSDKELQNTVIKEIFQHEIWLQLDAGLFTEKEAAKNISARSALSSEEVLQVFDAVRLTLTPFQKTVELLEELVANGVPCYGLTNMSVDNYEYLKQTYSFFGLFSGIVASGYEKCIKPDSKIFNLICDRYQLKPGETLFIDDSLVNIEAAHASGLQALHFENADSCISKIKDMVGPAAKDKN